MGFLDQLKQMVAKEFDDAVAHPETSSKEKIDSLAKQKTLIDSAIEEHSAVEKEKNEILKSYSEAVQHQSFKDESKKPNNNIGGNAPSIEEVLQKFYVKEKE